MTDVGHFLEPENVGRLRCFHACEHNVINVGVAQKEKLHSY